MRYPDRNNLKTCDGGGPSTASGRVLTPDDMAELLKIAQQLGKKRVEYLRFALESYYPGDKIAKFLLEKVIKENDDEI